MPMEKTNRIRSIAVYLGSAKTEDPHFRRAVVDWAECLARHEITLVFGGSNSGMMALLADTVLACGGRAVGVFTRNLPERLIRHDLTQAIFTDDLAERKSAMLRLADAAVALPGSIGTFDELFDALARRKLGLIRHPIGVLNVDGFFDSVFELLRRSVAAGFGDPRTAAMLQCGRTPEELLLRLQERLT